MEFDFMVVLFKNKIKQKIIKKFKTFKNAQRFIKKLKVESENVIFEKLVEYGKPCKYEIGLVELSNKQLFPIYMTDEMGRNIKVKLEDDGMTLSEIFIFRKEEKVFDVQTNKKIDTQSLIKRYIKGDGIKMISSLNNKVVIQDNDKVYLFSLKNESESDRFIDSLSSYFFKTRNGKCIFVKDSSSAQRKYLFNILEQSGIDKKVLYRKFTTYPRSK